MIGGALNSTPISNYPVHMPDYTQITVQGHDLTVPIRVAESDDIEPALHALLQAAWPHYNKALRAAQSRQILEALQSTEAAFRIAPYSPKITEYGLLLALQHGDFTRAQQLWEWAQRTGMAANWPDYGEALREAIAAWNTQVQEVHALREACQNESVQPSYRALLLLAERSSGPDVNSLTDIERRRLTEYGISLPDAVADSARDREVHSAYSVSTVPVIAAGLVGLLLGIGAIIAIDPPDDDDPPWTDGPTETASTSSESSEPKDSDERAESLALQDALAQANLFLSQESPIEAYRIIDTLGVGDDVTRTTRSTLQVATYEQLFELGIASYQTGNYSRSFKALRRVANKDVGSVQERLYYLGMVSAEVGNEDQAVRAFRDLQKHITNDYPHFEAQSLYKLVTLLPTEEAVPYAQRIVERYPDTIYNNSVVQSIV